MKKTFLSFGLLMISFLIKGMAFCGEPSEMPTDRENKKVSVEGQRRHLEEKVLIGLKKSQKMVSSRLSFMGNVVGMVACVSAGLCFLQFKQWKSLEKSCNLALGVVGGGFVGLGFNLLYQEFRVLKALQKKFSSLEKKNVRPSLQKELKHLNLVFQSVKTQEFILQKDTLETFFQKKVSLICKALGKSF